MEIKSFEKFNQLSPEELIDRVIELQPLPIKNFVASNLNEQKTLFLNNKIVNPTFKYDYLENLEIDEQVSELEAIRANLEQRNDIKDKYREAYLGYVTRNLDIFEMMLTAREINRNPNDKNLLSRYTELNTKLYGEVETGVFNGLVEELTSEVSLLDFQDDEAAQIRDDLIDMLPNVKVVKDRFIPNQETLDYYRHVVDDLYGGMIKHIPDNIENFYPKDIKKVFDEIIKSEYEEAAEGWEVVIKDAGSINVIASEKQVVIPENRDPMSRDEIAGLVVHELGVHMLRSIMGEETDMPLLKMGLSDYYDSEEGLGRAFEQALTGKYEDSGVQYYLIAGLMSSVGKDNEPKSFRETYEIMWRRQLLLDMKEADLDNITEDVIAQAKDLAFRQIIRIARGTSGQACLLKDLAYFRGSQNTWEHLERIKEDDLEFMFTLMGKADPLISSHKRILLESSSK